MSSDLVLISEAVDVWALHIVALEIVDNFCYLGDSLNSEGGSDPHCYISKNCMGKL